MARPIRVEYPGASYHVMARGNEKREIFKVDADRSMFLKTLGEMASRFGVKLLGYVLMPNHFHLLITTSESNLSRSVGWLQTTYTIRFNHRYHRVGHLFQGRFKAQIVEQDSYAMVLVPYVHLNPIRTRTEEGLKMTGGFSELRDYKWSSHPDYTGERRTPLVKVDWDWLKYWGKTPQEARWHYRREIRRIVKQEGVEDPWEKLEGQLVLGGEKFAEEVKKLLDGKKKGEEQKWQVNREIERRQKFVKQCVEQEDDWRIKIWLRIKMGMERPVDLAREMGYRDGGSVLQVIKRLEKIEDKVKKITGYELKMSRIES